MDKSHQGGSITFNAECACDAVRELAGRWFTAAELPRLPLRDCNLGVRCECRYRHEEDHRHGERRTHGDRRDGLRFEMDHEDRRKGHGRRGSEQAWEQDI